MFKIQIYTREKQNRLTIRAEYGMILVLGGLLAACFFMLAEPNLGNKKRTRQGASKPHEYEMTLDYCFLSDSRNIFL